MATNVNLGKQQITIYPYQEITSVNADQILYNLVRPGVSNVKVEVYSPANIDQIGVKIYAGATMVFIQNLVENGVDRKFLIKCVLEDDVYLESFSKTLYWGPSFGSEAALYLYADLNYDLSNAEARYAAFSLSANRDEIDTNQNLVLATLLNHQYFVKMYNSETPKKLDVSLNYYYVSYQDQLNPDAFPEFYNKNNRFIPSISGDMLSVSVPAGVFMVGNTLVNFPTTTVNLPDKIASYPAGKTADDLYQIDVLRLKVTKSVPRVCGLKWESMVLDKPTPAEQWSWASAYSWTEDKLLSYLSEKNLTLHDSGHTLLLLVRPSNAVVITDFLNQYPTWATVGFNKIHPSVCYIPKTSILRIDEQDLHSRFKLPVYHTSDLI